jgi:hypothetical protein
MKKLLLALLISAGAISGVHAQNSSAPSFSAGLDFGVPVGAVSNVYGSVGGIALKLESPLANSPLSLTLTTGYTFYVSKGGYSTGFYDSSYGNGSYSSGFVAGFVPVEAGAKVYVSRRIFIEGDLGASFNVNANSSTYTNNKVAFIYAPVAGVSIPVNPYSKSMFDFTLKYEDRVETGGGFSQIAIGAAYRFGL